MFAMVIGVVGFYFVVSDINTIITNSILKNSKLTKKYTLLLKIQEQYEIDKYYIEKAQKALLKKKEIEKDFLEWKDFINYFPEIYSKYLKYEIYISKFKNFKNISKMKKRELNILGDKITEIHISSSK